ncbi:MAG: hypothetical protein O3A13_16560, partial [Proteobacteria bacterium]|nr:hypothetical protein [Pseudomonadota bacterium]
IAPFYDYKSMGYRGLQSCPRYTVKGPFVLQRRYKLVYRSIQTNSFAPTPLSNMPFQQEKAYFREGIQFKT